MAMTPYAIMVFLFGINSFEDFFPSHDLTSSLKLKSFLSKQFQVQYILYYLSLLLIIIGIKNKFICFHWYLKKSNTGVININPYTKATIY